jgi:hypothetical protein
MAVYCDLTLCLGKAENSVVIGLDTIWATFVVVCNLEFSIRYREFHLSQSKSVWVMNRDSNFISTLVSHMFPRTFLLCGVDMLTPLPFLLLITCLNVVDLHEMVDKLRVYFVS